jgi:2-polyprenyl-3-methyl-5-hydroxy-6-metoxy-1,4-benzoquinol methylase
MTPRRPLAWLMRHHRSSLEPVDQAISEILQKLCPQDFFSHEMWRVGCAFYQRKLGTLLGSGAKVLDLGCGTGCWSIAAANLGAIVTAIDLSAARIECAKQIAEMLSLKNIGFKAISLAEQAALGERYDFVICNNTIQYIPDFNLTMSQIGDLLKPDGTLILSSTDIGIIPYLALESTCSLNARKMLETLKALMVAILPNQQDLHNGAYITQSKMRIDLEKRGYRRHTQAERYISAGTLIPERLMGLPLYYEAVYASSPKEQT